MAEAGTAHHPNAPAGVVVAGGHGVGTMVAMKVYTQPVGDDAAPLTCYLLDSSDELATAAVRPAVLVLPGGGYFFTSDREAEPIALAYLAEGFNAFVLRYAVGAESPFTKSLSDAEAALAWIRSNAVDLGIDPARVAAVGFSAGGHLAASLGVVEARPDALVLGYPVTLEEFGPPIGKDILDIPSRVDDRTPPTFLFSTADDTVVPICNSLDLLSALARHRVPFESHIYLLGPHGLSLSKPLTANGRAEMAEPSVVPWLADSVRFLHTVFGDFGLEGVPESFRTLLDRRRPGLDMPIGRLLEDERAARGLREVAPEFVEAVLANPFSAAMSIRQIVQMSPEALTAEQQARVEAALQQLD